MQVFTSILPGPQRTHYAPLSHSKHSSFYLLLICRLLKALPEVGVVRSGRLASGQNKACWGERLTQNRICCTLSLMPACNRTSEHSWTQEECHTDSVWNSKSKFRLRFSTGKIHHFVHMVKRWIHFVGCGYALKCSQRHFRQGMRYWRESKLFGNTLW